MKVTIGFLNNSDELVRDGHSSEVRANLSKVILKNVPRQYCARLANLSNRVGFQTCGVKLLNPYVRENLQSTPQERLEYSNLLMAIGAQKEAFELLNEIDDKQHSRVLLYKSYILISEWDYKNAVPLLREYVGRSDVSEYDKKIAEQNLASSLSALGENEQAIELLEKIIAFAEKEKYKLLLANAYGVYGSAQCVLGDLTDGICSIKRAEQVFGGVHITYKLLVERWSAYADYQVTKSSRAIDELVRIKNKAKEINNWETARDTEYMIAYVTDDAELAKRIYAGTPYTSYRERIVKRFGIDMNDEFLLVEGADAPTMDLVDGYVQGKAIASNSFIALMRSLTRDSYKKLSLGNLNSLMFPGEYYNPETTPNKIYQLLHRFKSWSKKSNFGLSVDKQGGFYSLKQDMPYNIKLPLNLTIASLGVSRNYYQQLVTRFGPEEFTAIKASEALETSKRHTLNILKDLKEHGKVRSFGENRNTMYSIVGDLGGVG